MASINQEALTPYLDAYMRYLDVQVQGETARPYGNVEEDYKRGVAEKAAEILDRESWTESEIGSGRIGDCAIKAVQNNVNLVGRFQVTSFSDKARNDISISEKVLYDLYHEQKDIECFEQICSLFGRKYDLVAYLYFIYDSSKYLPLRSSIFDGIFSKLGIDLQTSGNCSWSNYQEFLSTMAAVRNVMQDYYHIKSFDLLDAHSFLWTISSGALDNYMAEPEDTEGQKRVDRIAVGSAVAHKDYGKGIITRVTEEKVYVSFGNKQRIFPYPGAFLREYLRLK